ncbi:hypothetical protein ACWDR0_15175 [Streptomyces sp. NPDC003691]
MEPYADPLVVRPVPEPGREGRATPCEKHDTRKEVNEPGAPWEGREESAGGCPEDSESEDARRRRRAAFLRELNEAKALRDRVQPRRARAARMRQQMRMRTFRW